ncbi:hypothetical protein [Pseudomonas sp. MWU13-2105]|uniref:hypothetical protein n=1 Tax=Pseudomonas sp. MWU13-2105 TaxID=2935074 RepID=UPI00200FF89B|nr:hypothetical protein [Pseudomonas sp. MWU13-2105]
MKPKDLFPLILIGFSFGAYVAAKAALALHATDEPCDDLLLCGLPYGEVKERRNYDTPTISGAYLIHGEQDEDAPLHNTLRWAALSKTPIMVVPDADHFFSGKLGVFGALIRDRVIARLANAG